MVEKTVLWREETGQRYCLTTLMGACVFGFRKIQEKEKKQLIFKSIISLVVYSLHRAGWNLRSCIGIQGVTMQGLDTKGARVKR